MLFRSSIGGARSVPRHRHLSRRGALAVAPALLYYPSKVWWRFAIALGWVNARIILTVAFAIVLTPISLVWRLIGRDPLQRKRDGWKGWTPYPERYRRADHFTKMY